MFTQPSNNVKDINNFDWLFKLAHSIIIKHI